MEGSIRQRGSSFTVYWSTTDPTTGKRIQHTKGGFKYENPARRTQIVSGRRSEGDSAREFLNLVIGKVQDGTWRPDSRMTVRQLLVQFWLPTQESRGLRPATISQYRLAVDHWLVPNLGGIKIAALTPGHVNGLKTKLLTAKSAKGRNGLSPRSVQVAVTVLKTAFAWAVENRLLGFNPIMGVQAPRVPRKEMRTWQPHEARAFLKSTSEDRLAVAWALLLTRGLRRGQVCGVRWQKVNWESGVLTVETTRVVVDGIAIDSTPKTDAGRRPVPLDVELLNRLRTLRAWQAEEKLAAGGTYEDGDYLLSDQLGRPYHPDTISKWFDEAVRKAGLPRIRLHDTRHTAASLMLASGVPTKVVSGDWAFLSNHYTWHLRSYVAQHGRRRRSGAEPSSTGGCRLTSSDLADTPMRCLPPRSSRRFLSAIVLAGLSEKPRRHHCACGEDGTIDSLKCGTAVSWRNRSILRSRPHEFSPRSVIAGDTPGPQAVCGLPSCHPPKLGVADLCSADNNSPSMFHLHCQLSY